MYLVTAFTVMAVPEPNASFTHIVALHMNGFRSVIGNAVPNRAADRPELDVILRRQNKGAAPVRLSDSPKIKSPRNLDDGDIASARAANPPVPDTALSMRAVIVPCGASGVDTVGLDQRGTSGRNSMGGQQADSGGWQVPTTLIVRPDRSKRWFSEVSDGRGVMRPAWPMRMRLNRLATASRSRCEKFIANSNRSRPIVHIHPALPKR